VVISAFSDVENFKSSVIAVLLSEEAASIIEAFFGAEQALTARTAARDVDAGRLVVLGTGR